MFSSLWSSRFRRSYLGLTVAEDEGGEASALRWGWMETDAALERHTEDESVCMSTTAGALQPSFDRWTPSSSLSWD